MSKRFLEHAPTVVVAVVVVGLALADGGYGLTARGIVAVTVWWAVILGLGLALLPFRRIGRDAYLTGGLLAALGVLAGLSVFWSASPERSFVEFDRVFLYVGVFILVVLASTRENLGRWTDGLAAGIAIVGLLALTSRLFPGLPGGESLTNVENARSRLAFPFGYWNALGMLLAIGLPLLIRTAVVVRPTFPRAVAVGVVPALSAAIFLTSSRGAVGAALVGIAVFVVLASPRAAAIWSVGCAGAGSVLAVYVLTTFGVLVNRPLDDLALTAAQGQSFALFALAICAGTGALYALGIVAARGRGLALPAAVTGRGARLALGVCAVVALIAVVVAANPSQGIDSFKQSGFGKGGRQGTTGHLLSTTGGGRYQFWSASVEQFQANPVVGGGAGSYEFWWAANPRFPYFVRDAHSLWLETLGELGLVGFVLLVAAVGYGLVSGIRRLWGGRGPERVTQAALCAVVLAWAFAAAVDWMWEFTLVTGLAIVCLGLMTGPATARASARTAAEDAPGRARRGGRSFGAGVAVIAVAWLVICAQASPLLSEMRLTDSRTAADRGDLAAAFKAARGARTLQPWAGSPYRQLALIEEARERPAPARRYIREALSREPGNFELWRITARLEENAGDLEASRRSLERSNSLNPKPSASAAATVTP